MSDAQTWIDRLNLEPHPEGGYFRRTYASDVTVPGDTLPDHGGDRPTATAIYYLLEQGDFSAFHRLTSDELWHFYCGEPLTLYLLDEGLETIELGRDRFQAVVPAGTWFAAEVTGDDEAHGESKETEKGVDDGFSLLGCSVTPGFDFEEFELAGPELADSYPAHRQLLEQLTRDSPVGES